MRRHRIDRDYCFFKKQLCCPTECVTQPPFSHDLATRLELEKWLELAKLWEFYMGGHYRRLSTCARHTGAIHKMLLLAVAS